MSYSEGGTTSSSGTKIWFRIGQGIPPSPPPVVIPPRPPGRHLPPPPKIRPSSSSESSSSSEATSCQPSRPSQGVTVTYVANDIVCTISVILDSIARAIIEFAPYLVSFVATFSILGHTYNAVEDVVLRFFGRYFRI